MDLLFILLISANIFVVAAAEDVNQLTDRLRSLFKPHGEKLYPCDIIPMLRSLKDIYDRNPDRWPDEDKERVNDLFELTEVSESKCSLEVFRWRIGQQMKKYAKYKRNVIPFFQTQIQRQYSICKPSFESQFKEEIKSLTEDERKAITAIRESIVGTKPDRSKKGQHLNISNTMYEDGLSSLVLKKSKVKLDEFLKLNKGKQMFMEEFDWLISKPCLKADFKSKELEEKFNLVTNADIYVFGFFTLRWYENIKLCQQILSQGTTLKEEVYKKLVIELQSKSEEEPPREKKKHLFKSLPRPFKRHH